MQDLSVNCTGEIEPIVNTYANMLYRICFVMLKNASDAEDAVQETIIKYFQKKPALLDNEHTKAWLITVAKNECRDILRYRQRHLHTEIDENLMPEQTQGDSGILEALMTLPEKFRLVLVLYYVEEYKIEEIAKIIGKTTSCVKMRLQKGRKLLKEKYTKGGYAE